MLFMGEEYGEDAPFQFFTDHIDRKIADATRDGRRREFAAFAQFAGEEIPDPQDPATFERSRLSRRADPQLAALYAQLLAVRRDVVGEATCRFDEDARWLVVRRGEHELAMNFGREAQDVPAEGELVLATTEATRSRPGHVRLPALSGALLR